jgi:hypothetical protein
MITKEKVKESLNRLPNSFTIDELIDQLIFVEKVEEGIRQSNDGKLVSNENVKELINKWSD